MVDERSFEVDSCLVLEDGTIYQGQGFGSRGIQTGEVVFNTSMTGYQEILTDPASYGQIIVFTYPLLGNYGITSSGFESARTWASGLVVKEHCVAPSNWQSMMSLEQFCKQNNLIGISGIDTRALAKHLRDKGTMRGVISAGGYDISQLVQATQQDAPQSEKDLVKDVSIKESRVFGEGKHRVVVVDLGLRKGLVNYLLQHNLSVIQVPVWATAGEIMKHEPDRVVLAGGPGEPIFNSHVVALAQQLIGKVPILGISLGHLVLGLVWGGRIQRLKFGHRGANQPVRDLKTGRVYITSQNHGYVVGDNLPTDVVVTQRNLNDGTIEGMRHRRLPVFSYQFYPLEEPGAADINLYFEEFLAVC